VLGLVAVLSVTDVQAEEVYRDSLFAVERTEGIVFATAPISVPPGDLELLLDLYEPAGDEAPVLRPGLIIIHGAGSHRARPMLVRLASAMAGRGYTVVSIDFRPMPRGPRISAEFEPLLAAMAAAFPGVELQELESVAANVEDAVLAYQWLVEHSADLQVDPTRIGMGGISRGGMITLHVAYTLDDYGVDLDPPLRVVWEQAGTVAPWEDHMEPEEPPLVIIHGTADPVVIFDLGEQVQQHAHWAGIPYDFMAIEGAGHLIDFFTLYPGHYLTALDRIVNLFYVFMATPTPVELGHFELTPEHDRVVVRWRTRAVQDD
jgi:acetyl esterase/lipase